MDWSFESNNTKLIVEAYKKEVIVDEVRPLIISLEEEDSDECYSDSEDEN
jgi:hypothetical protein